MDGSSIREASNNKANNRNSNSTIKCMDRERAWIPVTARPATEETSAKKEAPARAWMPAASRQPQKH